MAGQSRPLGAGCAASKSNMDAANAALSDGTLLLPDRHAAGRQTSCAYHQARAGRRGRVVFDRGEVGRDPEAIAPVDHQPWWIVFNGDTGLDEDAPDDFLFEVSGGGLDPDVGNRSGAELAADRRRPPGIELILVPREYACLPRARALPPGVPRVAGARQLGTNAGRMRRRQHIVERDVSADERANGLRPSPFPEMSLTAFYAGSR